MAAALHAQRPFLFTTTQMGHYLTKFKGDNHKNKTSRRKMSIILDTFAHPIRNSHRIKTQKEKWK